MMNEHRAIQEVVVVEGIHDRQRLESVYPGIECIVTGGSEVSEDTLNLIARASEQRGVILFLDPDYSGRKITNKILERIERCKIAFIRAKDSRSRNHKKVGVEHASSDKIQSSLENMFEASVIVQQVATHYDLCIRGLSGKIDSRNKRYQVCDALNLPRSNAKTFLRLINMLSIAKSQIDEVMQ